MQCMNTNSNTYYKRSTYTMKDLIYPSASMPKHKLTSLEKTQVKGS